MPGIAISWLAWPTPSQTSLVVYYPYLLVDPAYQRRGVGTRLVAILKKKYQGYRQQVLISMKDAIAFYEKRGFALSEPLGMQILNQDV